jgi:hypothetical protein
VNLLVLRLCGMTLSEYLASLDSASGKMYYILLGILPSCRFW